MGHLLYIPPLWLLCLFLRLAFFATSSFSNPLLSAVKLPPRIAKLVEAGNAVQMCIYRNNLLAYNALDQPNSYAVDQHQHTCG